MLSGVALVHEAICSCRECEFIDKPPCLHRAYEEFMPHELRYLAISESPPPGRKPDYIYNLRVRDRLRTVLARALEISEMEVPRFLMENGIFWTTAVKCRPPSKKHLEKMRRSCVRILKLEVKELKPRTIIALGLYAWRSAGQLDIEERVLKLYHPLYLARFRRSELKSLRGIILGNLAG